MDIERKALFKNDVLHLVRILPIFVLYVVVMQRLFNTVCPFLALTHIPCPGCGLTHACIYLLQGKIGKSLQANPTAIFWVLSILLFLIDRYIKPLKIKPFPVLFSVTAGITVVYYIYHLAFFFS